MAIYAFLEKKSFLILASLIFIFQVSLGFYFAVNVTDGVYPDEGHHTIISQGYKETIGILDDSESFYQFGQVSRQPFLYHWAMGRALEINQDMIDERLLLRCLSVVAISTTSLVYFAIAREFTKKVLVQILPVFLLLNTLMYLLMSGAVNYDSFAYLFSSLATLFFVRFVKYLSIENILYMLIALSLGALSKISLLPFALILLLLTTFHVLMCWSRVRYQLTIINWKRLIILSVSVFAIGTTTWFYGENIIRYRQFVPDCDKVLSVDLCSKSLQYLRDMQLEKISIDQPRVNLFSYVAEWFYTMLNGMFGFAGHVPLGRNLVSLIPFAALFMIGMSAIIRKVQARDLLSIYLLTISLSYGIFLLIYVNYATYLRLGEVGVGIHGRYIFPVYFILLLLMVRFVALILKNRITQISVALLLSIIFLYGGIGFFYREAHAGFVRDCDFIITLPNCE